MILAMNVFLLFSLAPFFLLFEFHWSHVASSFSLDLTSCIQTAGQNPILI